MTKQSDIDTDKIVRVMDEIQARQRPPSGEHAQQTPCKMEDRMTKVEAAIGDHARQLGDGAQQFVRLEMGLANVAEKVGELIGVLKWAAGIVGGFVVLTACGAILWAIVQSGAKASP